MPGRGRSHFHEHRHCPLPNERNTFFCAAAGCRYRERPIAHRNTHLAVSAPWGIVDRVNTPDVPIPPAPDDLRGLARGLHQVVDLAERTLSDEAGPSAVGRRIMAHLDCELADVITVTERFPLWQHVNVQRGVDAYLATHGSGEGWIGLADAWHRPHENLLTHVNSSSASRISAE